MEENKIYEDWYANCVGDLTSLPPPTNCVTKLYVDSQIEITTPIVCKKDEIVFSIKDKAILTLKEDGVYWYTETGEEIKIKDSEVLSIALEAVVRSILDINSEDLYKKLKKKAFNDMITDIGIQGERLIKLEKLFNEKNI